MAGERICNGEFLRHQGFQEFCEEDRKPGKTGDEKGRKLPGSSEEQAKPR